ncbi:hypothetical protein LUZ60_014690 [Juncus effusus]|nr:hypothetical protein LUZ60_014690 [Juncus effusus]
MGASNGGKPLPRKTRCDGGGKRAWILIPIAILLGGWWVRVVIEPPEPVLCGSEGGPPVTAPRIRLRDGRYLAYAESGVPKEKARVKIVFSHGFSASRLSNLGASRELIEELGVYMVGFDRAGYGESDPNPNRSVKSAALDMEELADSLQLGPTFYFVGFSLGCHAVWGAIKYIPHRIEGAALLAPVVNHRWPGFPRQLASRVYNEQQYGDQWALRMSYYAPWLLHWWMRQTWLPTSTVISGKTHLPNELDREIHERNMANGMFQKRQEAATKQGIQESYFRDMAVMFGKWDFDPMDLQNPGFQVHLWQGDEDGLVPVRLQRYICEKLGWIKYHELERTGHFLSLVPGFGDEVLKTLLVS